MYNNYLIHHGVKGMKWGKRRKKVETALKTVDTKLNRAMGLTDADVVTYNRGRNRVWDSSKGTWVRDSGKANSRSGQAGLKNVKTTKVTVRKRKKKVK